MNQHPKDIDQFLPYGEMLRGYMEQSFVNKSDLKDLLRMKGVFIPGSEKQDTIPLLMSLLLSPDEFDYLRECQSTKEDNPKYVFQSLKWDCEQSLIEAVPDDLDFKKIIDLPFSNYSVVGKPNFVQIDNDPNHIVIKYNIERKDYSKNWASNKSTFPGSIELTRNTADNTVRIAIAHTSSETKQVAFATAKHLEKHFKSSGYVNDKSKIEKILFSDFTNSSRIGFLWSLTIDNTSDFFLFDDIVDLEFGPDPDLSLPEDIGWMEKKIERLKLNGKSLHNTFFVEDTKYHHFICLYRLDAKFKFDIKGFKGECIISVSFPDYSRCKDQNAEIEVNVKSLALDLMPKGINLYEIKKLMLKELESKKHEGYAKYTTVKCVA
ncbi:hypothetical protein Gbem_2970 [Citrifermentans bemidjiense Bem]|uniref:GAPS4b N-terminal domain-containing protein n=1 Tax=Citrifermentans bemidjiense (strain ATCC BAA-1014 / DSM 16622 / JCM 12645 / Bem) TaxID=404380 RepID=B5EJ18_CITBB|nr:hypothetical protein [Citrifermentans bemidjiense]ACH39973.1 hypothetical protein Gbem_2970 [Citrifermentans bemidjiense Bem]